MKYSYLSLQEKTRIVTTDNRLPYTSPHYTTPCPEVTWVCKIHKPGAGRDLNQDPLGC